MEFTITIYLLVSLLAQWFPMIKGAEYTMALDRQERDTMYSSRCYYIRRSTGSSTVCTCKSQYATLMSPKDSTWNCYTPEEIGCHYYLGETDKTYIIDKTKEEVEIVPSITGKDISIYKIYIWNYVYGYVEDYGHWMDVTDAVSRFFALDHGGNKLLISDLDLNKWSGHAIKIVLSGGKCVVAKMRGRITYPIDVEKFKHSVMPPVITTTTKSPKPKTTMVLDRQERDTLYGVGCIILSRSTGNKTVCTCKPQYATMMSTQDSIWNCKAPKEIGCNYYLGERDKTYIMDKTKETVEIVPSITGNDISIQNIFIWNYRFDRIWNEGHWMNVTDAVLRFFTLDHVGKNKLLISDLDLNKWRGHAIKIVLGGGKCVVAKMRGRITYPINVDEFKHSVTTPVTTTTMPVITTTTPSHETTASVITRMPITGNRDSKVLIYIGIGVVLVVVIVVTVSIFIVRQKRSAKQAKFDENTEHKLHVIGVENMHVKPDIASAPDAPN